MRILIADDDDVSRLELEALLGRHGHEVAAVTDGTDAWEILQGEDPPRLAVLDWLMEDMDGVEVCRRVRERPGLRDVYVILLTSRGDKEHVLEGLRAGANDYVTKPFDRDELLARVRVGEQMVGLQAELAARVRELEDAMGMVKQLQGLLPICSYCKSIRDDENSWHQLETYVKSHSEAVFSHGICPCCWEKVVQPQLKAAGMAPAGYPRPHARPPGAA
jgi:sigma-B regulation protein RsbU (phosphoserine phosphatase)